MGLWEKGGRVWSYKLETLQKAVNRAEWAILVGVQETRLSVEMQIVRAGLVRFPGRIMTLELGCRLFMLYFWKKKIWFCPCPDH